MNRRFDGQYLDLTDEDISSWQVKLHEFEEQLDGEYVHRSVGEEEELRHRRRQSYGNAISDKDDFVAVLRLQVEIEQRIRERIIKKLPRPERLGGSIRLDLAQSLSVAAALDAIPGNFVKLITKLGEIRNLFAHKPGYVVSPAEVSRLKKVAESCGFDDTRWAFDQSVDETIEMSEESRDLRMVYNTVLCYLDDEFLESDAVAALFPEAAG